MPAIRTIGFAVYYVTCGVILLQIPAVHGWRPYQIFISNITTETYSPKCRINASLASTSIFTINVEFTKHIRNPFMHTDLYLASTDGNYDMELLNSTVDYCDFLRKARLRPVAQMILRLFDEHFTNWFKSCPLNKGFYFLKNVKLNVDKLPPIFPEKSGIFKSVIMDKHERLYRLQIFFQIVKTFRKNLNLK